MVEPTLTLDELAQRILRPSTVATFGETAVRVFEIAMEETGDLELAAQLALAARQLKTNEFFKEPVRVSSTLRIRIPAKFTL